MARRRRTHKKVNSGRKNSKLTTNFWNNPYMSGNVQIDPYNPKFLKLSKPTKIKLLQDTLTRECYQLAEYLQAESFRDGFVR